MSIIDLSRFIEDDMPVYPGDKATNLLQSKYLSTDGYNNFRLKTEMHAGTHIDSPMHLTSSDKYISEINLEAFAGEGCILNAVDRLLIQAKPEHEKLIKEDSILLLYSGWDKFYGTSKYYDEHPCLDVDFCSLLIKKRIKMLGIDFPSPDRSPFKVHKYLLENNIFLLENLTNLDKLIGVERFEVIALPLKIKADSSLTRAVARLKK